MSDRVNRRCAALSIVTGVALLATGVAQADIDSARQALADQHYPQAMQALDAVLADKPDDPEARFLKGLTLAREQQPDEAIALFEQLTSDYPDMAEAWNNLGVLYARQDQLPQAKQSLEKAVDLDADYGPAQENLGDVYVALAQSAYDSAGKVEDNSTAVENKSQQLESFLANGTSLGSAATSASTSRASDRNAAALSHDGKPAKSTGDDGASEAVADQAPVDISTPSATLKTWAAAWSAQDVDRYLSTYAAGFQPQSGRNRSAWEALRRKRVSGPSRIRVEIADVNVDRQGSQARVTFNQHYQSPTYQDREHKALMMTQSDEGWKITHEGDADKVDFAPAANDSVKPASSRESSPSDGDDDSAAASNSTPAADTSTPPEDDSALANVSAVRADVVNTLNQWAQAWSNQNVQAYLAVYSDNYQPRGGQSLAKWIQQRGQHFKSGEHTQVTLADIEVAFDNPQRAIATFDERYQSPRRSDEDHKRVVLVREDGGWRIKKES